jgi:hypothetical protein
MQDVTVKVVESFYIVGCLVFPFLFGLFWLFATDKVTVYPTTRITSTQRNRRLKATLDDDGLIVDYSNRDVTHNVSQPTRSIFYYIDDDDWRY